MKLSFIGSIGSIPLIQKTPHPTMKKKTNAFTLIEILIVVAIIGLLATMAIPAFRRAQQSARESAITNNLRQVISAAQQYMLNENVTQVTYNELTTSSDTVNEPVYLSPIEEVVDELAQFQALTIGTNTTLVTITAEGGRITVTLTM